MEPGEKLTIDELALVWVSTMIRYLKKILVKFNDNCTIVEIIQHDLHQFKVIAAQLEMLLCTRPINPWAQYFWRQNFVGYLSQIIRRSQLFFLHLSECYFEKGLRHGARGMSKTL